MEFIVQARRETFAERIKVDEVGETDTNAKFK